MGTGFIWSITIRFTQQRHFTWKEVYDKSWLCPAETDTRPFIYVEHQWCLIKWNEVERRNCYLSCGQCQHDSQLPSGRIIPNRKSSIILCSSCIYSKKSRSLSRTGVKDKNDPLNSFHFFKKSLCPLQLIFFCWVFDQFIEDNGFILLWEETERFNRHRDCKTMTYVSNNSQGHSSFLDLVRNYHLSLRVTCSIADWVQLRIQDFPEGINK